MHVSPSNCAYLDEFEANLDVGNKLDADLLEFTATEIDLVLYNPLTTGRAP